MASMSCSPLANGSGFAARGGALALHPAMLMSAITVPMSALIFLRSMSNSELFVRTSHCVTTNLMNEIQKKCLRF
jgi:hypothetical protein